MRGFFSCAKTSFFSKIGISPTFPTSLLRLKEFVLGSSGPMFNNLDKKDENAV